MRQQITNTNTDRQTGRAGLYLLQFKTSSHLAPVCHTEGVGMKLMESRICPKCKKEYTLFAMMPMHVCPDCYRNLPNYKELVEANRMRADTQNQ